METKTIETKDIILIDESTIEQTQNGRGVYKVLLLDTKKNIKESLNYLRENNKRVLRWQ